MKKLAVLPACLGCCFAAVTSHAIDLKQSKVTQVVNDVEIISAADQKEKAATINDVFSMPDILRTGAASRAELVAADETVTRVGANTIFSFDPANRTIDLKQGSLLFHSPHGKGGGTIHTGSATASVLGTTLIVVTTQKGGLKVIALEGQVQVNLPNGLKQQLNAGQMTFLLPGSSQLAPVVLFRLDELTQNSLLVKGFAQTLASLPVIQNEVNQQLKQISSGKLLDTGYYAGDTASPNQVEVLDANTITSGQNQQPQQQQQNPPPSQNPPPPPPSGAEADLSAAEAADATINQSSLADSSIPTPPQHIIIGESFPVPNDSSYFGNQQFNGFVARNIYINTLAEPLDPLVVNIPLPETFDLVAVGNFYIDGSVTFDGLASSQDFGLFAADENLTTPGGFVFAPGISITANAHDFTLGSPAAMTFDNVTLNNNAADINLNSGDVIDFEDGSTVNAAGRFIPVASSDITFANSTLNSASSQWASLNGKITINNSTLNSGAHAILTSPSAINFESSTINADSLVLNGTTAATISIDNTAINSPSSITAVSAGDINVTGSSPVADTRSAKDASYGSSLNSDPNTGSVSLISSSGAVNVSGTSITAHYLTLTSGDGILLDASGHSITAAGSGATANFTDSGVNSNAKVSVNNADLSSFAVVNMAANTIDLLNVAFGAGSAVSLRSLYGVLAPNPNTGQASIPGDVNFIAGVTYGGDPAQNHIGSGITISTLH